MAIIAVFTNRNLIFEQKTSANQYRSTLALEVAEAGLGWATAMLNKSGKISDAACLDSAVGTDVSFRDKYLNYSSLAKTWATVGASGAVVAACVTGQDRTDWTCNCPEPGTAPAVASPSAGGYKPGFAIAFINNTATRSVDLVSYGCTSAVTAATCSGDASATVRVTVANVPALATPPGAPMTARGEVSIGNAALGVKNLDPTTAGVTVNAGMGIDASKLKITTTPGTPPTASLVGNDDSLRNSTEDQLFQTFFGVPKAAWRDSVADAILTCPCTETTVNTAIASGHRKLWLNGDFNGNSNVTLGSATKPILMIVDGAAHMNGSLTIYGVVYSTAASWNNTGGGNAQLIGAAISEGDYTGNGTPDYIYDPSVIGGLTSIPGLFSRVPGSWRDF
jgi:Tfp pilus assembly protein PilX